MSDKSGHPWGSRFFVQRTALPLQEETEGKEGSTVPRPSACAAWLPCLDTLSPGLPCVGANKPPEHTLRWTCLISRMPTRLAWALKGRGRPGGCGPRSVSHLGCHILQRLAWTTQEKGLFAWEAGLGSEGLVFWDGPMRGSRCHGKCHQQVPGGTEVL